MKMNKIIRLSVFNIKKHKLEAFSLTILIMFCMMLLGSSLSSCKSIKTIFPDIMKKTESWENYFMMYEKEYDKEFINILHDDERVTDSGNTSLLYDRGTKYLDKNGDEQALYMAFITQDNDEKLERFSYESSLSKKKIDSLKHPIYMPFSAKDNLCVKEGDTFSVVYGTRKFDFDVAGFYDTIMFSEPGMGMKFVVVPSDYAALESILCNYHIIGFDSIKGSENEKIMTECIDKCEDYSQRDLMNGMFGMTYEGLKENTVITTNLLLYLLIVMSVVIIISVAVMIRFRIAADIKEQIVSIGVLEAIGYKSKEITFSYVAEYLMLAFGGVVLGIVGCFGLSPTLFRLGEMMSGYRGSNSIYIVPILLSAVGLLAVVGLIAYIRAAMVRKYPPVQALRKGIGSNHFHKDHLPLRKTKSSVHLRLAMKGFIQNFRQSIGLTFCITLSSITIVLSFILYNFLGKDMNVIAANSGIEMSDLRVTLIDSADAEGLYNELSEMPEVRKVLMTCDDRFVTYVDHKQMMLSVAFDDFSKTENIFAFKGRFPEHDNEVMFTSMWASEYKLNVGDTVTLESNKVQRKYIISGIVTCLTNGGMNLYITDAGYKRLDPAYLHNTMEIYLKEGVDAVGFKNMLTQKYGRSVADVKQDIDGNAPYEERVRAAAEKKIAELMSVYGVDHVEYAIQSGDNVITGNSSGFVIKYIQNLGDIMRTQLSGVCDAVSVMTRIFMLLAAIVVMVILFVLMESSIRKQRKEFGIMKGLGYTSKELMLQLAARIIPAALLSVIFGTVISVIVTNKLTSFFGKVEVDLPAVIVLDIFMILFCFGCAYIGARKIRKISVYELMTE